MSSSDAPQNYTGEDKTKPRSASGSNKPDAESINAAHGKTGQYQKAIDDCTMAVKLDRQHAHAYYNREQAYEKLGKHALAKKDLAQAQKLGYKPEQSDL
jgi:tetratricopeptide (TPR) repeat protein